MAEWWDAAPVVNAFDAALEMEKVPAPVAALARSIYQQESGSGANTKTSNAGAVGGMQILPTTFKEVADAGWDIKQPVDNARAGIRYANLMYEKAGGNPELAAAGYYGGPGGLEKAKRGVAVSDPRNPNAPNTLQYGKQVAGRMANQDDKWWEGAPVAEEAPSPTTTAAPAGPVAPDPPFMAAVGRGIMDKAQGMKQAYLELAGKLGIVDPDAARRYTEDVQKEISAYESGVQGVDVGRLIGGAVAEAPLMATPGGPVLGSALAGAAAGATNFVPEGGSRAFNTALGAGIGGAVGGLVPATRALFGNKATETVQRNVELARQMGINPRPSQYTDNAVAKRFEMMIDTMPGGAAALQKNAKANQSALNGAVLNVFGRAEKEFTPEVVDDIYRGIDNQYAAALQGQTIRADMPFIRELARVRGELTRLPKATRPADVESLVADPVFRQPMDAATYNSIRSSLGRTINGLYKAGDSNKAKLMEGVQDALDDLAYRALPPAQQTALIEARSAYRTMAVADRAIDPTTGNISAAKLVTAATKNDPIGMKRQGIGTVRDITDVARAASTIAKTPPDSGTAARMGLGWGGYPVTGTLGAMAGGPLGAAAGLAISLPGSYLAGRAYLSPAARAAAQFLEEGSTVLPRVAPLLGGAATQY